MVKIVQQPRTASMGAIQNAFNWIKVNVIISVACVAVAKRGGEGKWGWGGGGVGGEKRQEGKVESPSFYSQSPIPFPFSPVPFQQACHPGYSFRF